MSLGHTTQGALDTADTAQATYGTSRPLAAERSCVLAHPCGPSRKLLSQSRLAQRRAISNWISQLEHAKLQSLLVAKVSVGVDILLYHHPMVTKRATATLMDPVWAPAFFRRQAHRIRACLTLKAL